MTNNVAHPSAQPGTNDKNKADAQDRKNSPNASKPDPQTLPKAESGAHEKGKDESIKSRSADPGQSSYGGFSNEDTRRQAQDLDGEGDKK